jgi:hypothetical protein
VSSWRDEEKVVEYIGRIGRLEQRRAGEEQLADVLPAGLERVLDLGCGDGVLIARAMEARPTVRSAWTRRSPCSGLVDVDCFWRWRGFALLVGHLPGGTK